MRLDYLRGSLAIVATVLSFVSPVTEATVTGSCAGNACLLNFSPSLNFGEVWAARTCPASTFSDVPGKIKGPWGVYVYGSSFNWTYGPSPDPLAAGGNFCFFASTNGFSTYGWDIGWATIYVPPYGGGGGGTSPPVVSLTSPVSGASFSAPATIPLSATASSPNSGGSILKVEFYNGASLLTTALGTSPYSYNWTNVGAGTYSLTAKAYDNGGRTTTTAAASVTVNSVPVGNVADGSFELPSLALGAYVAASGLTIAGSPWTFAGANGSRGLSTNGSAFTALTPSTTDGKQVAFIQGDGTVSQLVSLAAGNYTVSVKAIQRKENQDAPGGSALTILIDGNVLASWVPNNVSYVTYSTQTGAVAAGNHTITIKGSNQFAGHDNTLFVDLVKVASINQPPTVALTITPNVGLVAPANVTLTATASDPDGTIAKVEFYDNGVLINSDAVSPYSFFWTNIAAGSHNVSAQAYDNLGAVAAVSQVITVSPPANLPPSVTLTVTPNLGLLAPANVTLTATAADSDGAIAKVEFYDNGVLLNIDAASPYSYVWNGVAAGSHTVTAKAYDNLGATASANQTITVTAVGNVADGSFELPSLALGSYVAASSATIAGSPWTFGGLNGSRGISTNGSAFTALTPSTTDGKQVAFIQGDSTVSQAVNVAAGNYTVSVKAIQRKENQNAPGGSALTILIDGNVLASWVPNNVSYVTYSTQTGALSAGNHTITIKGTNQFPGNDNTLFIDMVNVAPVNQAPTVTLTVTPSTGLVAPATTTLTATASDLDGTIAKVEFYDGALLLNTDTTFPYSFVWTNIAAGTHTVIAKAYDNLGATGSATQTITVSAPPTGLLDGSFELPLLPATNYVAASGPTIAGSPWTFAGANGSRGLSTNGSVFTAQTVNTTDGNQVAFIQGDGSVSQLVNLAAGNYQVMVKAIQRKENTNAPAGSVLTIEVDSTVRYSGVPNNIAYLTYATPTMALAAGSHTITIRGTNQFSGNDNTLFVDMVTVGPPNQLPTVTLTVTPSTGLVAPATATLNATASDPDGPIAKVEFYDGASLLATDLVSPYSYVWTNIAAGTHTVVAKATDSLGATVSASQAITVASAPSALADGSFELPSLALGTYVAASGSTIAGSPWTFAGATGLRGLSTNGSAFTALTVNTSDGKQVAFIQGDGTVSQTVTLAAGTYQVALKAIQRKENQDPSGIVLSIEVDTVVKWTGIPDNVAYRTYATPAMALAAGSHTITIRGGNPALNDNTIFVDTVYLGVPASPTVTLTGPIANQVYTAPATVTFAATAASPNSAIAKVEFWNGATLQGTDVVSPYGFTWSNAAAGAYSLYAQAYDNLGAVTASGAVQVFVCGPPTVTLTSPASGATGIAPATFTLSATASTATGCGSIQRVEFYGDGALLNTDTAAPYTFDWSGVPVGSHTLLARAYDSRGLFTDATVVVNVSGSGTVGDADLVCTTPVVTSNVGATPGNFGVSDTGAATYSIPIQVPPGTAGMQPNLAMNYSSQGGSGHVGAGWAVSGLSMIGHCAATEAQDGKRVAINYDIDTTNDAYCLDGQRLVAVTQGFNSIEYRTEIESYSKIVRYDDNVIVKGPGRWRVWTKSGQILDYGSRWWILSQGWFQRLYDGNRDKTVKVWALDHAMDRNGNYMEIDYDGTNGAVQISSASPPVGFNAVTPPGSFPDVEFWPTAIRYYSVHSSAVTDPGYNEVVFNYSDRSSVAPRDVQRFYDQGAGATTLTKKLDSIRVTVDKSSSTAGTVTRTYFMSYAESPVTNRMLLQTVQECAGDGTCLPDTTFAWSGSVADLAWFQGTGSSSAVTAVNADASSVRIADLNGDGKSDMIRYVGTSGFMNQWEVCLGPLGSCATYTIDSYGDNGDISRWEVADTVGDGKARLLTWDVTSKTWRVCLFNGSGFDPCQTWSGPILYRTNAEWNEFFWGDFDGDGKIDILSKTNTGHQLINGTYYNFWDMCFGTGNITTGTGFNCIRNITIPENTASGNLRDRVLIADMNGDGRADYLEKADQDPTHDQWRICLSKFDQADTSKGFDCPTQYTGGIKGDFERAVILDVNGDGLADMVTLLDKSTVAPTEACSLNPNAGCWQVCIATGDGGFEYTDPALHWTAAGLVDGKGKQVDPLTAPRCRIWSGQNTTTFKNVLYGDFNGDGRTDTAAWDPSSRTFVVCYSTGSSFNCVAQFNNFPSWPNAGNSHPASEFSTGDFNGDGKTDIAIRSNSRANTWVLGMASDTFGDQLKTITTGLQATTTVAYAPITNASVYVKGNAAQQSLQPRELVIQTPLYVVQETRASNAIGGVFVSTYYYEGLKGRTDGRGIEGFFRRRTLDGNGIVTEVESLQIWPLSGRPMRMSKWAPKDGLRANPSILQTSLLDVPNANFPLVNASTQTWQARSYAINSPYQGLTIANIPQPTTFARSIQQVHLIETREQSFEYPNGPALPLPETVTTIPIAQVDAFGNRGFVQVSTYDSADGGSYLKETTSTYNNDNANWILGRVQRTDVRSVKANGETAFRASSWIYGTTQPNLSTPYDGVCWWGMVCSEIVEPDYAGDTVNYGLWQETQYLYDRYGNRQSATIRFQERDGANVVTIKSRTTATNFYDGDVAANNRGRFSLSTINALNHKESRVYDNRFGTVAVVNGPNGLSTSTLFDGLGRRVCDASFDATNGTGHRLSQTEVLIQACASADPSYPAASTCQAQESYRVRTKASGGGWGYSFFDNLQRERRTVAKSFNINAWAETATAYDALGRKANMRKPAGAGTVTVQPTYDVLNRVTSELTTGNDGSGARTTTTSTVYSALTTTVTRTNPSGGQAQITSRTVNSQWLATSATDAVGTSRFAYDPFGNLTQVNGPTGIVVTIAYDKRGRKITMTDPDMGFDQATVTTSNWQYAYNGAGELIWQHDAKGQDNRLVYDVLGRLVERREYAGAETGAVAVGTLWTHDSCAVGKGKLCSTESHSGMPYTAANLTHKQSITYDGAARPMTSTMNIGASTFVSITQYDNNGRVAQVQYPTGLVAAQSYTGWGGHLSKVTDAGGGMTYWQASSRYLDGQIASMQVGPHTTTRMYDPLGRVKAVVTPGVQNASYTFDEVGNLLGRGDAIVGQATESFGYDLVNRLVTANGGTIAAYDAAGNITSRSGTGAYTYWPGTHRLRTAGGSTYNYDADGSLTSGGGRTVTMAPFNMPSRITGGGGTLDYVYDGSHARIVETSSSSGVTYFVGNQFYEEQTRPDGSVYRRHYISTPEGVIALVLQRSRPGLGNDTLTRYWHKDHLGSLAAVTSETGAVVERFTYDVWGRRLTPYIGTGEPLEERGFTGHEMLDDVAVGGIGLVHMNGRIYDPFTGRFLSADPLVQDAYNIQSYNRYTYVLNNPLSFTDPTGFSFWTKWRRPIIAIIAAIATYGIASAWMAAVALESANGVTLFASVADFQYGATVATLTVEGSAAAGAAAGFAAGGIMGGNLESATYGAITGAVGGFVSGYYAGAWTLGRVGVQTAVGAASAYLTGGDWRRAAEITLAISLLSYGNVALRELTIESSRRFAGICSTDNFCVNNMSGSSVGLQDDNLKAGGSRLNLTPICDDGLYTCIKSDVAPWKFNGTGEQLRELLLKQESPLGGVQGGAGKFIGMPYSPGSLLDRVVESFSGPHDYFNSGFWYDNLGNAINRTGLEKVFGEVLNGFNVFPASSFAVAVNIPAGAYDALAIRPKR